MDSKSGMLIEDELRRYERHIKIFGEEGQEKLKNAKVFIGGTGARDSSVSIYLMVAGIAKIRMVEHEIVELSNLNRQILRWDNDIGKKKIESAEEKLRRMNPNVQLEVISKTIDKDSVDKLVGDFDMIVDAMDNFPTRYSKWDVHEITTSDL